jgi:hypothetical protein
MTRIFTPQQNELLAAGPHLYRAGEDTPFGQFGFETPPGWHALLLDLTRDLEAEIVKLPEASRGVYVAMQVKEKFGTLRVHMSRWTDALRSLVDAAERRSATTCAHCSEPATMRRKGATMVVMCDVCSRLFDTDVITRGPDAHDPRG